EPVTGCVEEDGSGCPAQYESLEWRRVTSDDDEQRNQGDPREGIKLETREREDQEECSGAGRAPLGPRNYLPHREEFIKKIFFALRQFILIASGQLAGFLLKKTDSVTVKVTNFVACRILTISPIEPIGPS